jgi:hypothetical protein
MKLVFSALIASTLAVATQAEASPARLERFAYGVDLAPLHDASFHRYPLPASVLRMMVTPELTDLCVFDAAGAPRAHALRWPSAPQPAPEDVPLALFPLEISRETQGMEVKVERDSHGQILRTLSQPLAQQDSRVRAYLLDAHALEGALRGLTLALGGARDTVMVEVLIETSADLTSFHELARTTVAQLQHGGERVERDFVELPSVSPGYLRISFDPGPHAIVLERASARVQAQAKALPRSSIELEPRAGDSEAEAAQLFRFLVPHGVRIERYRVQLPEGSPLVQASLFGAASEDGSLLAIDRQLYRTPASTFPLSESRVRVLELRVDDVGGGIRSGAPRVQLDYVPPELLFAGDGKGPFTLAFGSREAGCTPLASDALELEASARQSVRALRIKPLGGPALLDAAEDAKKLRVYGLWAALVIAVAVLGLLARRLLRSV